MKLSATSVAAILAMAFPAAACAQKAAPMVEYLTSEQATSLNLPFAEAVRVGNVLYLSGMIAVVPGTLRLVPGGIEAQTRQALENIDAVLKRYGSSLDHVFKCTVLMTDISEWREMNAAYVTFFEKHLPARSAIGVSGLALGARVEIECMATVGEPE
jgi:2-iminobutanoate/2-iminopropanoate deaminase